MPNEREWLPLLVVGAFGIKLYLHHHWSAFVG